MKYISADLETCGLFNDDKSKRCPETIIGLSMVVEDTDATRGIPVKYLPHFTCLIDQGTFTGEPYALQMNAKFLKMIAKGDTSQYKIYKGRDWISDALAFLDQHFGQDNDRIIVCGKNFASYDLDFFPTELTERFSHVFLDPASIFLDWNVGPEGLGTLKKKHGMSGYVSHDMHEDSCDVIALNRQSYPPLIVGEEES